MEGLRPDAAGHQNCFKGEGRTQRDHVKLLKKEEKHTIPGSCCSCSLIQCFSFVLNEHSCHQEITSDVFNVRVCVCEWVGER